MIHPDTAVITQARRTSSRLPDKVLLEAAGRPMLQHHLDRLADTGFRVIVATTTNATDDAIVELAEKAGAAVTRGSEEDVLSRFAQAIREHGPTTVVRVTSDCPLVDASIIRDGVEAFHRLADPSVYVSNAFPRTYPRGLDFEIFSASVLLEADEVATERFEREHVTAWLHGDPTRAKLNLPWHRDASAYRITLDTADDLRLLRALIEDHDAAHLDVAGIVAILDAHPELAALNAHVEQKKLGE